MNVEDGQPITTGEYHERLGHLITAFVSKAVTFEGSGLQWEDAERFLDLALAAIRVDVDVGGVGPGLSIECALLIRNHGIDVADDTVRRICAPLSETVIRAAKLSEEYAGKGEAISTANYHLEQLRASVGEVEAWIAAQNGEGL